MKTSVSLAEDIIQIVKDYAAARNLDLDTALSNLVRKGIESPLSVRLANGLYVADLPAESHYLGARQGSDGRGGLLDEALTPHVLPQPTTASNIRFPSAEIPCPRPVPAAPPAQVLPASRPLPHASTGYEAG
jgi:hypothetical protein